MRLRPVTEPTDLAYLSAADALARFRSRELSPVELVDAVIARAEAVEPTVTALCHRCFDAAHESAREEVDLHVPAAQVLRASGIHFHLAFGGCIGEQVAALLERYDALICPTVGTRGPAAGDDYADHGLEVGGRRLDDSFETILTPVFNVMSRLPVLNVLSGHADNGVPTGVQIAGRSYDDVTVFRVGAAIERTRPWGQPSAAPTLTTT